MKPKQKGNAKKASAKSVLRVPDLEVAKSAVLNSLCLDAQRGYRRAIGEFVDWYCSEPRLSFSKTVVIRYRMQLESRHLAPGTINLRLGAVRRLACEAADCGLLSADLAAGIWRVKGVKKLGARLGNWLTAEQGVALWQGSGHKPTQRQARPGTPGPSACVRAAATRSRRVCGLRRHEVAELTIDHLQQGGRTLGDRRPQRQGRPRPDGAGPRLGLSRTRRVDRSCRTQDWKGVPSW